jgi:hypothetical protein
MNNILAVNIRLEKMKQKEYKAQRVSRNSERVDNKNNATSSLADII